MAEVLPLQVLLVIFASITAGVLWNMVGIWQKYKEEGLTAIDWLKVRKNVIVGSIVGFGGYVVLLDEGVPLPEITTFNTFLLAIVAFFPFVVIADRIFTRKKKEIVTG